MAMKYPKKKVLECLWMIRRMNIGILISPTLTQVIAEVVEIGLLIPDKITIIFAEDMLVDVDLCNKRPANLPLGIGEHEFMLNGEVDIGLIPANIPPINKLNAVDF